MKKYAFLFLSFILIPLLFTAGCKDSDSATNPEPDTFSFGIPKVGDRWDYRMISGPDTNSFSSQIVQKFANNVYQVKQTINWKFNPVEIDTQYMYVTADEYKEVNDPSATQSGMRLFTTMELNKDYTYKLMAWSRWGSGDTISYKLLSKAETVTVPAGTFSCFKIRMIGTGASQMPETFLYISPGSGQIKIVNQYSLVELTGKNF